MWEINAGLREKPFFFLLQEFPEVFPLLFSCLILLVLIGPLSTILSSFVKCLSSVPGIAILAGPRGKKIPLLWGHFVHCGGSE